MPRHMHIREADVVIPPDEPKAAPAAIESPQELNRVLADIRRVADVVKNRLDNIIDIAIDRQNELNRPAQRPRMIGEPTDKVTKFSSVAEAKTLLSILIQTRDFIMPWSQK